MHKNFLINFQFLLDFCLGVWYYNNRWRTDTPPTIKNLKKFKKMVDKQYNTWYNKTIEKEREEHKMKKMYRVTMKLEQVETVVYVEATSEKEAIEVAKNGHNEFKIVEVFN